MEFSDPLITALTGAIGVGGGSGVTWLLLKAVIEGWVQKFRDMEHKMAALETEKIAGLERRLTKMEESCVGPRQQETLNNLLGWMKKNDLVLGEIRDGVAGLKVASEADRRWTANLSSALDGHKNDHTIHGVHHRG